MSATARNPLLSRLGAYRRKGMLGDLRGGLTAALIGIPTEMIYGLIAVAPLGAAYQFTGILAAFSACIVAAIVTPLAGGHLGQIPGSRPALALIVAALLTELLGRWPAWFGAAPHAFDLLTVVFATVALAGLLQIGFGLLRLGQLVKYLPAPVLSGITNGVAILILLQVIRPLLGMSNDVPWSNPAALWQGFKPLSLVVGLIAGALYLWPSRRLSRIPPIIVALVVATALHYVLSSLVGSGRVGPDFGDIPSALPEFAGLRLMAGDPGGHLGDLFRLILPYALTIAALASIEALLCASAVDTIRLTRHDSNRELIAQGVANIGAGLFGGTPIAATMPRTLVNVRAGAVSGSACLIYGVIIGATLLLLPDWIGKIPQAATAGILVGVAWQMIDAWSRSTLRRLIAERDDMAPVLRRSIAANALVMVGAAAATLIFGLVWALAFGILLTTLFFLRSNQRGVVRATMNGLERRSLRIRTAEQAQFLDALGGDIIIVEAQGPLFFGSADKLGGEIERRAAEGDYIVVDLARVSYVDATAARVLQQIRHRLESGRKKFYLSGINPLDAERSEIFMTLADSGFSPSSWFTDLDSALEAVEEEILSIRFDPEDRWRLHALSETTLGEGLSGDDLEVFRSYLTERRFNRQDVIYREADPGNSLFILVQGTVSLYLSIGSGHAMRLTAFSAGTAFGSLAVLEARPRSNTAIADVEVVVLELTSSALDQLAVDRPALAARIYRNLSATLADRLSHALESLRAAVGN